MCNRSKMLFSVYFGENHLSPLKDSMKEYVISFIRLMWLAPDLLYLSFGFYSGYKKKCRTPFWRNLVECWVTSRSSTTNASNTDPKRFFYRHSGNDSRQSNIWPQSSAPPFYLCRYIIRAYLWASPRVCLCAQTRTSEQNKQSSRVLSPAAAAACPAGTDRVASVPSLSPRGGALNWSFVFSPVLGGVM